MPLKVFVDSDVIISSLISSTGAASLLLKQTDTIDRYISNLSKKEIKAQYTAYILDTNDAHIVAGAVQSKARFLITYNTRHFKSDKLKDEFNIILTTPANFIQYLRSI